MVVFTTLPETSEFGWHRNPSPSLENSWIRWENIDFAFNYTPKCMVSRPLPRSLSDFVLDSGIASSILGRFAPLIRVRPQFTLPTCLLTSPQQRRTIDQTLFSPQLPGYVTGLHISYQDYVQLN